MLLWSWSHRTYNRIPGKSRVQSMAPPVVVGVIESIEVAYDPDVGNLKKPLYLQRNRIIIDSGFDVFSSPQNRRRANERTYHSQQCQRAAG